MTHLNPKPFVFRLKKGNPALKFAVAHSRIQTDTLFSISCSLVRHFYPFLPGRLPPALPHPANILSN